MTHELTVLALAILLQMVQFTLVSVRTNIEVGTAKTLSPRDPDKLGKPLQEQVSLRTGRLIRALNNHFEALIMFTAAVVVVSLGDKNSGFTAICAWAYLAARVLYVPAYYFGWVPWRSAIWSIGFTATLLMILSALY